MEERVEIHGWQTMQDDYATRTLDATFPQLKDYVSAGTEVLDVGCGPGSITLGVASFVMPGRVRGIDMESTAVERAQRTAAERGISNVTFEVGDGRRLPYRDQQFDTTYSHAFFDWVLDPIAALNEQKRVTKSGGWVCAMMVNNDTFMMYPSFACIDRYCQAFRLLADPSHPDTYHDRFVGRKALEIFKRAGFANIQLRPMEPRLWYAGQGADPPNSLRALKGFLTSATDAAIRFRKRLIELGAIDEKTIEHAQRELDEWLAPPYALHMQINVFAAGRVER